MPKKSKKRVSQRKMAGMEDIESHSDEENSTDGRSSMISSLADELMSEMELVKGEDKEPETLEQDNFEDHLVECIDGLLVKSAPRRKKFLEGLKQDLSQKYCAEFLEKRKETVTEYLLKCVKKGKVEEQTQAVSCLGLLAVQLGWELGPLLSDIQSALATLLADNTAAVQTRAQCASTMAMCCFVNVSYREDDEVEVSSMMGLLEAVFRSSSPQPKTDGSLAQASPALGEVQVSCLDAWCLLLTRVPAFFLRDKAESYITMLGDLLRSSDTELRIAAGEAIAVVYGLVREIDEDFDERVETTEMLCEQLKELSKESSKHKARSAMREQRARFRDILQTVQDGEVGEEMVKMGSEETLILEDWAAKVQYNAFCNTLQSGIFTHLKENLLLRDCFDLGIPMPPGSKAAHRMSKVQKKYYNNQADKARTISRAKNRDKRSAVQGF